MTIQIYVTGLRKVYPYYFTFTTFTKGRWVGEKILEVFGREFRAHPVEEYVSGVIFSLRHSQPWDFFYFLQERCILDGTLTVNYEQVDVDYRLRHNDLLANIVHRYQPNQNTKSNHFAGTGSGRDGAEYGTFHSPTPKPLVSLLRHETPVLSKPIDIVHLSEDLVVLDKPCSLPVSPLQHHPTITANFKRPFVINTNFRAPPFK